MSRISQCFGGDRVGDLVKGDVVRVVALTGPGEGHLVRATAERPPRIGDIGTVRDVTDRLGGVGRHYTVVSRDEHARPPWLAIFASHELELVGDERSQLPEDRR